MSHAVQLACRILAVGFPEPLHECRVLRLKVRSIRKGVWRDARSAPAIRERLVHFLYHRPVLPCAYLFREKLGLPNDQRPSLGIVQQLLQPEVSQGIAFLSRKGELDELLG